MTLASASPLMQQVGWLLVHSVWEFAAIALVLAIVLRALRGATAGTRYVLALIGWGAMLVAPAGTWFVLPAPVVTESAALVTVYADRELSRTLVEPHPPYESGLTSVRDSGAVPASDVGAPGNSVPEGGTPAVEPAASWTDSLRTLIAPWLNTLVVIWCLGVSAFATRSARGWYVVRRLLHRDVTPVPPELAALLTRVAAQIGLRGPVRLLQSSRVDVPLVVGWLRPVILLPVCVATGFSPQQLEAILAHELAHVRRHDYLINLLQNLSETVCFYHPALWWASAVVRREREHCCDELAARALGNRAEYGRALLALEELRGEAPTLALGAKGGSLLERIRRLAQMEPTPRLGAGGVIGIALVAAVVVGAVVWGAGARTTESASIAEKEPGKRALSTAEWRQHVVTIHGQNVKVTDENGVISTLMGPNKYFPAVVMETDGRTSYLLTTSWGAKDFWLGQPPSMPVNTFTIDGTETPVKVVAYDVKTGVAVFSVDAALPPVPPEAIGGEVQVGDRLIELQLPETDGTGGRSVLAVERVGADDDSNGATVNVPHLIVLEGMAKNQPGTLLLREGKLVALILNNFPFENRKYAAHAIPITVAVPEFVRLLAEAKENIAAYGSPNANNTDVLAKPNELLAADKAKPPETVVAAADKTPAKAVEKTDNDRTEITIIQAKNVLLLDGKHVVTWKDIDEKIAALPNPSRVHPQLYVTRGASEAKLWDAAWEQVAELARKYGMNGQSVGSLTPRTDIHYDRIKTPADLIPDASLRREGTVTDQDGKPIAGAEVILITPVDDSLSYRTYDVVIVSGRVRNPVDEVLTHTDAAGKFAVYPPKDAPFRVLALHADKGIALADSDQFIKDSQVKLLQWGGVVAEFSQEPEQQEASLRTHLDERDGRPEISITQYWVDLKRPDPTLKFEFTHVPPIWLTSISRDFRQPDGGATGVAGASVSMLPGETRTITLGPVTKQQRELLNSLDSVLKPRADAGAAKEESKLPQAAATATLPIFGVKTPQPTDAPAENRTITALQELPAGQGHAKYACEATVPADHYLWITLTEVPARRGYAVGRIRLQKDGGGGAPFELEFGYTSREQGTSANPLLSTVNEITYGWSAPKFNKSGTSIFGVPMYKTPMDDKKVVLIDPRSELAKAEEGVRLLLIIPKDANPQTRAEVEAIQPRGEIVAFVEKIEARPQPTDEQRLLIAWRAQRDAIGTSYIKFQRFRQGAGVLKPLSPAQVAEMFAPGGRQRSADQAIEAARGLLVDAASPALFGADSGTFTFRSVGNKTLETWERGGKSGDARYFDGELDIRYDAANRGAKVYSGDESLYARTGLHDFQLFSRLAALENLDVQPDADSLKRVQSGPNELVVNDDGFVFSWLETFPENPTSGNSTFQFDPQPPSGGFVLPRLRANLHFRDGQLEYLDLVLIEEARINEGFEPKVFALPLPAGTTIFDYRGGREQPGAHKVEEAVDDAAEYVRKNLTPPATSAIRKPGERVAADATSNAKSEETRRSESGDLLRSLGTPDQYGLKEGEVLKHVPEPWSYARLAWLRAAYGRNAGETGPTSIAFKWDGQALDSNPFMLYDNEQDKGVRLSQLFYNLLRVQSPFVSGPATVLGRKITGDWVVRTGTPSDVVLKQLNAILDRDTDLRVRLSFRTETRSVYVARGTYKFTPLKKLAAAQAPELATDPVATDELRDHVHVFGLDEALWLPGNGGGGGELSGLLVALENWTDTIIVNEVDRGPASKVSFTLHEAVETGPPLGIGPIGRRRKVSNAKTLDLNHDPDRVLAKITKQTGLTFEKSERDVRVLIVEQTKRE